jgi:hypothetical protein
MDTPSSSSNPPPQPLPTITMTAPSPPRINGNSGSSTPARTPRSGTPIATHLALSGKNHKIHEKTGYTDTRFAGKEEQFQKVIKAIKSKGFIPNELVENEVRFYLSMNILF